MKDDLISRGALGIGKAKRERFDDPKYADGWNSAVEIINNAPAVDAVEVCRCKDCKNNNAEKALRKGGIWCEYWGTDPDPDDFCSYGERRADDATD